MYGFQERNTSRHFLVGQTSSKIGPGSYRQDSRKKILPSFVSFGSSSERMKDKSSMPRGNPPLFTVTSNGHVQDRKRQDQQRDREKIRTVRTSTKKRFEDSDTIAPGAGTYNVRTTLLKKSFRAGQKSIARRQKEYRLVSVKSNVPTIPTKFQKFGYVVSENQTIEPNRDEIPFQYVERSESTPSYDT